MICLVMVSYAWEGGGLESLGGGICPPAPPPGLNPAYCIASHVTAQISVFDKLIWCTIGSKSFVFGAVQMAQLIII